MSLTDAHMTDQIIITLPGDISQTARAIAETADQSAEQGILDHLRTLAAPLPALPPDEQKELTALQHLSDDTLWTIARELMPEAAQTRARTLVDGQKQPRGTHGGGTG